LTGFPLHFFHSIKKRIQKNLVKNKNGDWKAKLWSTGSKNDLLAETAL